MNFQSGAQIDTRPESAKLKDFQHAEVASTSVVNWVEKPEVQWRKFKDQEQDGSGSCVAQTAKKLGGIELFRRDGVYVEMSATPLYQRRSNKPSAGMNGIEAFELWRKEGLCLESLVPSTSMSDAQMDNEKVEQYEKDVAKVFKIDGHLGLANGDIESVASIIQNTGKGVMVFFYFTAEEWSRLVPEVITNLAGEADRRSLRHSVAAVDFTIYQGKKALIIEDSAHFGGLTRRIITEDFYRERNWFARYATSFIFDGNAPFPKPHYTFRRVLNFSPVFKVDEDVLALQRILQYEGMFPVDVPLTGYYGAITAKGVDAFQRKYKVATDAELNDLQGRSVGNKTITKLNELYG